MEKIVKYELIYIKAMLGCSVLGMIYALMINSIVFYEHPYFGRKNDAVFFILIIGLNLMKYFALKKDFYSKKYFYEAVRLIEIFLMVISLVYLSIDAWIYLDIFLIIMITGLCKGWKNGMAYTGVYSVLYLGFIVVHNYCYAGGLPQYYISKDLHLAIFSILICGFISTLSGMIYNYNFTTEFQNKTLLSELEEKYDLLAVAQQEIKYHYEKIKETNNKLEETNSKLSESIGEFYTLQQISQAISSIFNIRDLLKYVNDIIIGVMGVNYSTVILFDEKIRRLKVHTTNINNLEELSIFNDNINCSMLFEVLNSGTPFMENFVDEVEFPFTKERGINSIICMPLMTKKKKFGLVLVEQKFNNAFNEGNLRLLDIISQQVSIAMENAELYQRMKELASIDSLTEIYNRLYFQQRMAEELKNAADSGDEFAVAIFDIDHFKKFNDTYGHLFGDKVIKQVAAEVKNSLRSSDVFARYGGEEFIILFPRTDFDDAYEKVETIRQKIANTFIRDELITTSVTASFGISCYPKSGSTEIELLRKADKALYEAKENGRNCVRIAI